MMNALLTEPCDTYRLIGSWNIVGVEDDKDSALLMQHIFAFYGARLYLASNGVEGIKLIRQINPDLVITNLSMPIMNGWEMVRIIRADSALMHLPVVALTAQVLLEDQHKAFQAGFTGYITKPFSPSRLIDTLVQLLAVEAEAANHAVA